jgi:hypothetical protein
MKFNEWWTENKIEFKKEYEEDTLYFARIIAEQAWHVAYDEGRFDCIADFTND